MALNFERFYGIASIYSTLSKSLHFEEISPIRTKKICLYTEFNTKLEVQFQEG